MCAYKWNEFSELDHILYAKNLLNMYDKSTEWSMSAYVTRVDVSWRVCVCALVRVCLVRAFNLQHYIRACNSILRCVWRTIHHLNNFGNFICLELSFVVFRINSECILFYRDHNSHQIRNEEIILAVSWVNSSIDWATDRIETPIRIYTHGFACLWTIYASTWILHAHIALRFACNVRHMQIENSRFVKLSFVGELAAPNEKQEESCMLRLGWMLPLASCLCVCMSISRTLAHIMTVVLVTVRQIALQILCTRSRLEDRRARIE